MKKQENPKIVLDEDLCGFRAGTVDALDFAYAAVLHIKNLEDENERLTDKLCGLEEELDEKDYIIDEMRDEIRRTEDERDEFYRRKSDYYTRGVYPEDF